MADNEFTVRAGLEWLGISIETYEKSCEILAGRHGNPIGSALLDARDAQGSEVIAADVLAQHGIDPEDPLAAVRVYDRRRSRRDN